MLHVRSLLSATAFAGLVVITSADATAQFHGLRNSFRIDNSHSGVGSEINVFTGWQWQVPGPLVSTGGNAHTVGGCVSQGTCTVSSNYGILRVTGSGNGTNCASSGVGLRLDQAPQAQFSDTMTVVSSSLPHGTPVQLVVGVVLDGFATITDSAPYRAFRAEFAVGTVQPVVAGGAGSASTALTTTVGASMQVVGSVHVDLIANGLASLGIPPQSATFACDLLATMSVVCVTPGASLRWASGGTYALVSATATPAGGGCGTNSPLLAATMPVLGQTQTWSVSGATPSQPAFLIASLGPPTTASFGPCVVRVDLANAMHQVATATDAAGACTFLLAIPVDPAFAGLHFTAQSLVLSPTGPLLGLAQLTNAITARLGT
ncbi:MAG: hypothetical protein IPK26_14815 [Planctomycetes bacterium]|nr:hypothetical protein [Planctomycetota bacterium]